MKTMLLLPGILLLLVSCHLDGQGNEEISYRQFIETRDSRQKALALLENEEFEKAERYLGAATNLPGIGPFALRDIAYCKAGIGQSDSACYYLKRAFSKGLAKSWVDQAFFSGRSVHCLEAAYREGNRSYRSGLDTTLLQTLSGMLERDQLYRTASDYSINHPDYTKQEAIDDENTATLKAIIDRHGWPGPPETGIERTFVHLFAKHADEASLLHFLDVAIEDARKGKVSWQDAESIITMTYFNFQGQYGLNKLRYITLTDSGTIDPDESYFQVATLADFLKHNPRRISLSAIYENDEQIRQRPARLQNLEELKIMLVNEGIRDSRITIDPHMEKVGKDTLRSARFAFTYLPQ